MASFFRNLFRTAGEVSGLSQQVTFYEKQNELLEWKVKELEKEVKSERRLKDTFVRQFCNQMSVKNGLYGAFKTPEEEKRPEQSKLFDLSPDEEEKILWAAEQMRNDDIESGNDPRPIEAYANKLREDPARYILN